MRVKELQALTQKFADAFDQRDLKTFLGMHSDDLEWKILGSHFSAIPKAL